MFVQPPKEKFERDLGGGRKLQADSSTKNNASRVSSGKQGGPSDSADARDAPDMKVTRWQPARHLKVTTQVINICAHLLMVMVDSLFWCHGSSPPYQCVPEILCCFLYLNPQ